MTREELNKIGEHKVVKQDGVFAHGGTLREARSALMSKLFDSLPVEKRVSAFVALHLEDKPYPNKDYFEWHGRLTGSCELGRKLFASNRGIDMSGSMTVSEFVRLTENAYGGEIVRQLRDHYEGKQ